MNSNNEYDLENNLDKNSKLYNLYFFLFFIYYAIILIVTGIYYQNINGEYNINGIIAFLLSAISMVIIIAKVISSFITVDHNKFTYSVYILCLIINCITCIYFALMYEFGGVQDGNTLVIIKDAFFVSLISLVTQNCVSLYLSRIKYD